MVRDDLYITIPSFFRCPISLDVMKSPVSLCTGVTYDRASIQRWLDSGNNTCPATMQVLQSKEFVPNKTLQRLIQIWYDSVRVDSAESQSTSARAGNSASASVVSKERIRDLVEEMKSKGEKWWELLDIVLGFARESEENKEFLAKTDGFVDMMFDFLCNCNGDENNDGRVELVERAVVGLKLVLSKMEEEDLMKVVLKSNRDCLTPLLNILREGSEESVISSIKTLEIMGGSNAEWKLKIVEREGLITELIRLINEERKGEVVEASLSCLITISKPKRIKSKLVSKKIIAGLRRRLLQADQNSSICEKALKLVEMMSTVKEGREEICGDSRCVQAVVQKVIKVSAVATEHAVTILWSLCYLFRDERAQEEVTKSNGLTKILLLMQSNCTPPVRQMCADLLKIFRVNSKSCLSTYHTNTTHIMPF